MLTNRKVQEDHLQADKLHTEGLFFWRALENTLQMGLCSLKDFLLREREGWHGVFLAGPGLFDDVRTWYMERLNMGVRDVWMKTTTLMSLDAAVSWVGEDYYGRGRNRIGGFWRFGHSWCGNSFISAVKEGLVITNVLRKIEVAWHWACNVWMGGLTKVLLILVVLQLEKNKTYGGSGQDWKITVVLGEYLVTLFVSSNNDLWRNLNN